MDFTDLSKACPKDSFPVPRIDQLVDATYGHSRISSLDAFHGYYQILVVLPDQEKITFLTPTGNYHYRVMPFELRNSRSRYQRMVTRMFENQLGKNVEAYIDDMVVKSIEKTDHLLDLGKIFAILKMHKLCLNAFKCFFGVGFGKLLGYMITH